MPSKLLQTAAVAAIVLVAACSPDGMTAPENALLAKGGCNKNNPCDPPPISANPKYHYSNYSVSANGLSLSNSIKQTGLGAFSQVKYVLTADWTATFDCRNKGGHIMPESSPFFAVETFTPAPFEREPSNGQVTDIFTITANAPADGTLGCGGTPASKNFSWQLRPGTSKWENIKFCWGQHDVTQGPVPGVPGAAGDYLMTAGALASGTPLDGDSELQNGIFATTCLAGSL